jgi:hypothetical protein
MAVAIDYDFGVELGVPVLCLLGTTPDTESWYQEQLRLRYDCK